MDGSTVARAGRSSTAHTGSRGCARSCLLDVLLVLLALAFATATARTSGASSRSTFLIGLLAVIAGPWGWTIRAQSAALPLFAGALWLLVDASRRGVRLRTLLVLPLLVLWANLHGSVVLGAGLTVLLGLVELVRSRRLAWIPTALVVLAPLCVLASPYGTKLVDYYNLMLVDAPFAPILREWQWSSPSATTALFWLLAIVAVGLLALRRCRSRLTVYELLVLAVTFAGAVQAVRGVIWFALACARSSPSRSTVSSRSRTSTRRGSTAPSPSPRSRDSPSRSSRSWRTRRRGTSPTGTSSASRRSARRRATVDASLGDRRTADWLLWRIPELGGRIAYDVRFELYDQPTLDRIVDYQARRGDWKSVAKGYRVVIVDDRAHLLGFRTEPDAKVVYRDNEIAIIARR